MDNLERFHYNKITGDVLQIRKKKSKIENNFNIGACLKIKIYRLHILRKQKKDFSSSNEHVIKKL